jgi:hypothetical protein
VPIATSPGRTGLGPQLPLPYTGLLWPCLLRLDPIWRLSQREARRAATLRLAGLAMYE